MTFGYRRLCVLSLVVVLFGATNVFSQGAATSSISGVVTDTDGGVIPGATVVVTSTATGTKYEVITNGSGAYSVPAISAGTYSVSVSLAGFKTALVTDVRVQIGIPSTVNTKLSVGELVETVTVTGSSAEIINTQTPTVAATLNVDQIANIPTPTRDVLNAVTYLVGVNTAGIARGVATVNGLPESFLNITLDGVSNNDNFNKSTDGFFAPVRPRQDAIEAVSVTSAAGGSDVGGSGAISINFVTRSGTNRFTGSAYEYYRDRTLNSNYWFNSRDDLEKNDVQLNQFGGRQGGPIVIPGLYDGHNKAFFFVHYEQLHLPNNSSRTRAALHPRAMDGWFRYSVTQGSQLVTREVNVLDLARQNGQLASTDPLVMRTLTAIQAAMNTTGTITESTDPLLLSYAWQSPAMQTEQQPAIRIDYNIGSNHRLSGTFNKLWQDRNPDQLNDLDQRWPGTPNFGHTQARRPSRSLALRSTLSSSMVNELRFGITQGERIFFGNNESNGPQTFDDLNGYAIDFDANIGLTNWHTTNAPSGRSAYQYTFDNTLSWQKGNHSLTFGGGAFLGRGWTQSQQMVPGINLRFDTNFDPAAPLFSGANFQGASAAQLNDARDLYALLTGRVGAVTGLAALNPDTGQYENFGVRRRGGSVNVYSGFVQDSWRLTPTFTLNLGLRYDVQTPFAPESSVLTTVALEDICGLSGVGDGGIYSACNFFQPNASGGKTPVFSQFLEGKAGYNTDWNNLAPNIGVAWRPHVESGFLRTLLGDPEQATIRGGYSVAYDRQGLGVFTGIYQDNPGGTISLTRDANTGLVPAGESWPVLLRETSRLYQAPFDPNPVYPIALRPNRGDAGGLNAFHPDVKVASARTWTVGLQRALSANMALEMRYVGTRGVDQWSELNYNERNRIENGFQNEFISAMNNLTANNAAGGARSGSFAYFGPGTGTSPLPIYLAYINRSRDSGNAGAYSGTTWTNTALTQDLVRTNPQPDNSAADLDGDATRRGNAIAAGYPANFFVVNPDAASVNVLDSGASSDYHSMQIELRRRLSRGLAVNGSYQYAREFTSAFLGFHYGRVLNPQTDNHIRHAIKAQWDWTVPVGRGERFGSNMNRFLDGVIGGWQFNGATRIQARMVNFGNVRMVGFDATELQSMYKVDIHNNANGVLTPFYLPEDIILNTRRAFSISTTSPTGYSDLGVPEGRYFAPANSENCVQLKAGDCAPRTLLIRAPFFARVDIGVTKRFGLGGNTNFEFRVDVLNLFDNVNFNPTFAPGTGSTIFQATTAYRDPDNTFDPGGRLGQLAFRLNW